MILYVKSRDGLDMIQSFEKREQTKLNYWGFTHAVAVYLPQPELPVTAVRTSG